MEKYGKLTILGFMYYRKGCKYVRCKCDCGKEKVICYNNIKRGLTKSCGCYVKSAHGLSKTRLYQTYKHMKHRCYDDKDISYKNYGGRGIRMCDAWLKDFRNFYNWAMAHGYTDTLTIDRKDCEGNYCPENCRWVTMRQQQNNRRNNRLLEYKGQIKTITEWATVCGLSYRNLYYRLKNGYTIEEAIEKPRRKLHK